MQLFVKCTSFTYVRRAQFPLVVSVSVKKDEIEILG